MQRFLGEGGKKRVFLAHDTQLDREVAVAVIKTEGLDQAGFARVRREARAMGRLGDHPHVVTVYDLGDEDGQPFIVCQYMGGGTVHELLQRSEDRRLPIERALRITEQVCQALEHAHAHEVVHRDLKPANVWLAEDGTAKLGDFGLALALDRSRLTQEGMMVGTVLYMPPEQALGRSPDARSDLYAVGAMLYEMVTGRPPFSGDDAASILSQHVNTQPLAPSWHNPEVSPELDALIARLLEKQPERRPASASAVREALAALTDGGEEAARRLTDSGGRSSLDRLGGGLFVGREDEMEQLRAAAEDAIAGRGRMVLLVGEPGIGKTRTMQELATYARLRGAQVLVGRCYEGEGAPAYWPWVQIVRSYASESDPADLLSVLGSGAPEIAQVVSEVRERLPAVGVPAPLEPEEARFRLFDSLTSFLRKAASREPLVLVLDDLHWADKPSLLLLRFLARELPQCRLLLAGTYRDVDVQRAHPLAEVLVDLRREGLYERVLLRGLNESAVRTLISSIGGQEAPEPFVQAVFRETEGNPFFVEEILRHLVEEGILYRDQGRWTSHLAPDQMGIPEGIREVIGRRLSHLSERCNDTLTIASAIGREFDLSVLEPVSELAAEPLLELLEEALAARVIKPVAGSLRRYGFPHALVRETLYDELPAVRRLRLHRRIGEVLEKLHGARPEAHLAELAHHFFAAAQRGGEVGKAVGYARRAGDRANEQLAYEEAVRHYEIALQALELADPPEEQRRCALLLAVGETLWSAGEFQRSKQTFLRAAEVARELGDPEPLAQAALGAGGRGPGFETGVVDEVLVGLLEEALAALGPGESALRARLMARLAQALIFSDERERIPSLAKEASEIARRAGDPALLASVLRDIHYALWAPDNVDQRLALAGEIVELAEDVGDRAMALETRIFRSNDLLEKGDISAVDRELEVCLPLAEQLRQPYPQWAAATFVAMRALLEGRFEEAERLIHRALEVGQRAQNQNAVQLFGVQLAVLRWEQGRAGELEEMAKGLAAQYPRLPSWRVALAFLYMDDGREADARHIFDDLAARDFADLPRNMFWLVSVSLLGEVCAFLGDAERAPRLYELLLPHADRCVMVLLSACFGSVSRYLGLLASTLSRWEEAERHFEAALETNAKIGGRSWVARTQHGYARMLQARGRPGDREKALELVNQALATAQELGMKSLVEAALATKLSAQGIDLGDTAKSISAVASALRLEGPDLSPHAAADGTVTLMFSDMEGFAAMTERLGDLEAHRIVEAHNRVVEEQTRAHGGHTVELRGDGFLLAFSSPAQALLCAVGLQRAFAAFSEDAEEPLRVRIGLHTGEALRDADRFFGKTVIQAFRIADLARGGEILVSSFVRELTEGATDLRFDEGREVSLKGLSGTHSIFAVHW